MKKNLVSIIAPVFNEEAVIREFVDRIVTAFASLRESYNFEIILVDDCSNDRSLEIMKNMALKEKRLRVLELRRNYGQTAALQAGLDAAQGKILITIDSDLQHFPEEIPQFLEKLEEGYDVVCGWRNQRAEGILRRWPSKVANYIIRYISGLHIHDFGTTYRAYRIELVKDLRLLGEFHRYIPALVKDIGGRIAEIPIKNIDRQTGKSNYGITRTFGVLLDLILLYFLVRYLDRPMRAFGKFGIFFLSGGMFILTVLVVYAYTYNVHAVQEHSGWFLLSIMLIIASVQIILSGIIAEILVRVHFSQGKRRIYHVRREWNFKKMEP